MRKQKTDRRDAGQILRVLVEGRFSALPWVPTAVERDARQLVMHRHKRVQMLTRVKNQLHALAINQGLRLRWKLWLSEGRQQLAMRFAQHDCALGGFECVTRWAALSVRRPSSLSEANLEAQIEHARRAIYTSTGNSAARIFMGVSPRWRRARRLSASWRLASLRPLWSTTSLQWNHAGLG